MTLQFCQKSRNSVSLPSDTCILFFSVEVHGLLRESKHTHYVTTRTWKHVCPFNPRSSSFPKFPLARENAFSLCPSSLMTPKTTKMRRTWTVSKKTHWCPASSNGWAPLAFRWGLPRLESATSVATPSWQPSCCSHWFFYHTRAEELPPTCHVPDKQKCPPHTPIILCGIKPHP